MKESLTDFVPIANKIHRLFKEHNVEVLEEQTETSVKLEALFDERTTEFDIKFLDEKFVEAPVINDRVIFGIYRNMYNEPKKLNEMYKQLIAEFKEYLISNIFDEGYTTLKAADIEKREITLYLLAESVKEMVQLKKYMENYKSEIQESFFTDFRSKKSAQSKIKINIITTSVITPKHESYSINFTNRVNYINVKNGNLKGHIITAKLRDVVEIYGDMGDDLFESNLRIKIEDKNEVDASIQNTIKNEPEDFWFLNNGITLIVPKDGISFFHPEKVTINNLSTSRITVVNGAQTITSASEVFYSFDTEYKEGLNNIEIDELKSKHARSEKAEVLLRIVETEMVNNKENELNSQVGIENQEVKEDIEGNASQLVNQVKDQEEINESQTVEGVSETKNAETQRGKYYNDVSRISLALNRQKPITNEDIAYFIRFVNAINSLKLNNENNTEVNRFLFRIIRRGERESIIHNEYHLVSLSRVLKAFLGSAPGDARSKSKNSLLEISSNNDDDQENDQIENLYFASEDIFKEKEKYNDIESNESYIDVFKAYYLPVNFAMKLNDKFSTKISLIRDLVSSLSRLNDEQMETLKKHVHKIYTYGKYHMICFIVNEKMGNEKIRKNDENTFDKWEERMNTEISDDEFALRLMLATFAWQRVKAGDFTANTFKSNKLRDLNRIYSLYLKMLSRMDDNNLENSIKKVHTFSYKPIRNKLIKDYPLYLKSYKSMYIKDVEPFESTSQNKEEQ
ncbi:AIPR family protein [Exiguobacterium aestuarii]|uniref:AIPR family protein n=1 Tax=Exiguobacterium aestuarii TaxID=273527 RepID=A0ABW2PS83_9BACL|nr:MULTISPECIES: AIPR family protein [Exiguobacterium]MCT4784753.1 AIPR family protein [Exiguobacterium aestuarii]